MKERNTKIGKKRKNYVVDKERGKRIREGGNEERNREKQGNINRD
jgi:hypothetical protein